MSEELKACPFCRKEGGTGHYEKCYFRVRGKSDTDREIAWQSRPLEDALREQIAELKSVIKGMFPMWIASMSYCEHGRKDDLLRMRNYYNGRDNLLTGKEIHLMFSMEGGEE